MAFDYDKIKQKEESQSYWATYSDLFMVLSLVFLMLYVVANLRSGTFGIQKQIQYKRITEQNEDLKQQIKVFEALKDNYLETQASDGEMVVYNQLMDKLHLLKDEANEEKKKLMQQAQENAQKEQALNQYQQLVRNIINSNLMTRSRLKNRNKQLAQVKKDSADTIKNLNLQKREVSQQLARVKSNLSANKRKLANTVRANEQLISEKQEMSKIYKKQMASLKAEFKKKKQQQRKKFEDRVKKQKLSAKAREKALQQFNAQIKKQQASLKAQLSALDSKVKDSESELRKAKASLNARKKLANRIKANFKKAGIDAQVDPKTGDVMLTFGNEYFDSGRSRLKPNMKKMLKKFVPTYSKSLFEDEKVAKKLSYVEIVGFASPTYKGKFVDPNSLDPKHQEAVKYNLDLSYKRASSIFDYIFNRKTMNYKNQKRLRRLVKVTGQGFLSENAKERSIASKMSTRQYCKKYDCKKAQRVIIKFDLEE